MPSFLNYLLTIPDTDVHPLKYVCRGNYAPYPTPHAYFLDDYVAMVPLTGESFTIDSSEAFTLIVKFVAGNETAEAKILPHTVSTNGQLAFKTLKDHCESVGVHFIGIIHVDKVLDSLSYNGEKKPRSGGMSLRNTPP